MYEEKFTRWVKWEERNSIHKIDFPGIYICAISENDLSDLKFNWIKEIEYIGMTNSAKGLKGRLRQFDNTLHRKIQHGGADRMLFAYQNIDLSLVINKLFVSVAPFECDVTSHMPSDLITMGEITKFEYVCIAEYVSHFDVLPKFNDIKNSKKFSLTSK